MRNVLITRTCNVSNAYVRWIFLYTIEYDKYLWSQIRVLDIFFVSFHVVCEYLVSFLIFSWITIIQRRILLSKTSEGTEYTYMYVIHTRYCIVNYSAEKMFQWSSQKNENIEAKLSAFFIWKIQFQNENHVTSFSTGSCLRSTFRWM